MIAVGKRGYGNHRHRHAMEQDKYIAAMEQNIKLLQKEIKNLDEIADPYKFTKIPEIKVHKSQLPFEVKGFSHDNSEERIKGHLLEEYNQSKSRKIVPMPGLMASFCYDFRKNEWWSKGRMHLIWGWEDQCNGNFDEVLKLVISADKQRFEGLVFGSIGRESYVVTKPLLLENGNQIVEEYNFLYHSGDYEKRSPILLQGKTTLIGINKR